MNGSSGNFRLMLIESCICRDGVKLIIASLCLVLWHRNSCALWMQAVLSERELLVYDLSYRSPTSDSCRPLFTQDCRKSMNVHLSKLGSCHGERSKKKKRKKEKTENNILKSCHMCFAFEKKLLLLWQTL